MKTNKPILLYSYRRCPYAMRARMALIVAKIQCEVYEVNFKNKPEHMLEVSPKGTVPVLCLDNGDVVDESLDIMILALKKNDPESWLSDGVSDLIEENDGTFKAALDRYKYPNRFPDEDCTNAQQDALYYLIKLNDVLKITKHLLGNKVSIVDIAIFPFVRQFANVDRDWFDAQDLKQLQDWLQGHVESALFIKVFAKQSENPYLLF